MTDVSDAQSSGIASGGIGPDGQSILSITGANLASHIVEDPTLLPACAASQENVIGCGDWLIESNLQNPPVSVTVGATISAGWVHGGDGISSHLGEFKVFCDGLQVMTVEVNSGSGVVEWTCGLDSGCIVVDPDIDSVTIPCTFPCDVDGIITVEYEACTTHMSLIVGDSVGNTIFDWSVVITLPTQ